MISTKLPASQQFSSSFRPSFAFLQSFPLPAALSSTQNTLHFFSLIKCKKLCKTLLTLRRVGGGSSPPSICMCNNGFIHFHTHLLLLQTACLHFFSFFSSLYILLCILLDMIFIFFLILSTEIIYFELRIVVRERRTFLLFVETHKKVIR